MTAMNVIIRLLLEGATHGALKPRDKLLSDSHIAARSLSVSTCDEYRSRWNISAVKKTQIKVFGGVKQADNQICLCYFNKMLHLMYGQTISGLPATSEAS